MPRMLLRLIVALLLGAMSLAVSAQPRAWLDRDRIGAGETVTLNIETTGAAAPDYAPLQRDFVISGNSSRRQFELVNGKASTRTLYAVALQPRRDGMLPIPALAVGGERTRPLSLQVEASPASAPTRAGDDVFIEAEADAAEPYVQQAVGWVVRLYSAVPLISGRLDQPAPDGASLQQVGDDAQYSREIAGRRYTVVERRYQLIPERSGALTIPGATFEGRGTGGFFDELFGDRGGALEARAPRRVLQVRAAPAAAPQPWLPLRDLQLRYATTPQELRAGSAATLTIEAVADGATAAQMPELQLPPIDGVQVFADPVQADEGFSQGRPRVKLTRKFSLVPARTGDAKLAGLRIAWWDVRAGATRTATLPPLSWQVAASDGSTAPKLPVANAGATNAIAASPIKAIAGANRGWVLATLLFAALWLFTLVWAMQHRAHPPRPVLASGSAPAVAHVTHADLKRALDTGDFGDVAETLRAMARPPARDLDEVTARLDDPSQREALDAMQRARWGGGDGAVARGLLRHAFARGPRWREAPAAPPQPLPPLYPSG
ncbi:MAG TPA: BatD family protein [Lysobacter sp.]